MHPGMIARVLLLGAMAILFLTFWVATALIDLTWHLISGKLVNFSTLLKSAGKFSAIVTLVVWIALLLEDLVQS